MTRKALYDILFFLSPLFSVASVHATVYSVVKLASCSTNLESKIEIMLVRSPCASQLISIQATRSAKSTVFSSVSYGFHASVGLANSFSVKPCDDRWWEFSFALILSPHPDNCIQSLQCETNHKKVLWKKISYLHCGISSGMWKDLYVVITPVHLWYIQTHNSALKYNYDVIYEANVSCSFAG